MRQLRTGLLVVLVLGASMAVAAIDTEPSSEPTVVDDHSSGDVEDSSTTVVTYAGRVVPLHEKNPIPDNDLSPVGNFKFCTGRSFDCFKKYSGLAFISGVVSFSGHKEIASVSESQLLLRIATGEDDRFPVFEISEIPPVDDVSRPLYMMSGFDQPFLSLPLAVEAAALSLNIPMNRIFFPIAECGGLYADHTNMQSKEVLESISGPSSEYRVEDGGVFAEYAMRCATKVYNGMSNCLAAFHRAGAADPRQCYIWRPSSSKAKTWTLQNMSTDGMCINFRYLGVRKRNAAKGEGPPVLGYHYVMGGSVKYGAPPKALASMSQEQIVEKFSRKEEAPHLIRLLSLTVSNSPQFGFDNMPDYYCGGEGMYVGPNHLDDFGPEVVAQAVRDGKGVSPWMKAWARGLSGVVPLPESDTESDGERVDVEMASKCASFFSSRGIEIVTGRDLGVSFDSVAGNTVGKKALWDNVLTPFIMGDVKNSRNILQYGPPGTGKSLLAKALVGELNKVSEKMGMKKKVTYIPITASNLEEKWIGKSEENVKTLFDCARAYSPTVIFFDEVDGLFRKRTSSGSESSTKVKSEFLVQLDGSFAAKKDEMVVFLGATNRPMDLDSAFRRRLPVGCYVGLPSMSARAAIIKMNLAPYLPEGFDDPNKCEWYGPFLKATMGYSGSDLVNLAKEAIVLAKDRAMASRAESLPDKIQEALESDPEMQEKVNEIGIMAILQENKPGSPYEMSQEEMTKFVSDAQEAVRKKTKVATGLTMADSELLVKAFQKIKRSVTRAEIYPLYDFILTTKGPETVEVPASYRGRLINDRPRLDSTSSSNPLLQENDVDWVSSL